ncbi:MAG: hypothetical protein WCE81_05880 [Halobacteriota archaeon]
MHDNELHNLPRRDLGELQLSFTKDELKSYVKARALGLSDKTMYWIDKAAGTFWNATNGTVSKKHMDMLRQSVLNKYQSEDSKGKMLAFAKAFLTYLTKIKLDTRYHAFEVFLEMPKALKKRKNITSRIITKGDFENILSYIRKSELDGSICHSRALQYTAFVVFGAYTGQRSLATTSKLTVGQFREALQCEKPVLHVESSQDKIKMEHYVPLHPRVIDALQPLIDGRDEDELMFGYNSFNQWIKRQKVPLSRISGHFVLGDLRKFAEQHGDVIQWEQSNRAYILTHGVSGVEWSHYRHPLPENVFDIYMRYWSDVELSPEKHFL